MVDIGRSQKDKGCDALEADNEDAYANETGWRISSRLVIDKRST